LWKAFKYSIITPHVPPSSSGIPEVKWNNVNFGKLFKDPYFCRVDRSKNAKNPKIDVIGFELNS